jgi:hypothetical protein
MAVTIIRRFAADKEKARPSPQKRLRRMTHFRIRRTAHAPLSAEAGAASYPVRIVEVRMARPSDIGEADPETVVAAVFFPVEVEIRFAINAAAVDAATVLAPFEAVAADAAARNETEGIVLGYVPTAFFAAAITLVEAGIAHHDADVGDPDAVIGVDDVIAAAAMEVRPGARSVEGISAFAAVPAAVVNETVFVVFPNRAAVGAFGQVVFMHDFSLWTTFKGNRANRRPISLKDLTAKI